MTISDMILFDEFYIMNLFIIIYIQQMPFFGNCSKQKKYTQMQNQQPVTVLKSSAPAPVWNSRGDQINYALSLGGIYADLPMPDSNTVWSLTLPSTFRRGGNNVIIFRKGTIVLQGVSAGFPTQIYITAPGGIVNMYNYEGVSTGCMAAYGLSSVIPIAGTTTFNVIYQNPADVITILPQSLQTLNLQVYFDEQQTAQQMPLSFKFFVRITLDWRLDRQDLKQDDY